MKISQEDRERQGNYEEDNSPRCRCGSQKDLYGQPGGSWLCATCIVAAAKKHPAPTYR